jgi:hypothetical protein
LPFTTSTERGFQEKSPLAQLLKDRMNITGRNERLIVFGIMIISGKKITER